MGRNKGKETKALNFRIDPEIADRFKELALFENMGSSEFLELLILRWDESINPEKKLESLFRERDNVNTELGREIGRLEFEIGKVSNQREIINKLNLQKRARKPEAIKKIEALLLNGDFEGAQRISRFLQKQTGISAIDLIVEAKTNLEKTGI